MNQLSNEKRAQILSMLCEGVGINAACRITNVSKHTVLKFLADADEACAKHQDADSSLKHNSHPTTNSGLI